MKGSRTPKTKGATMTCGSCGGAMAATTTSRTFRGDRRSISLHNFIWTCVECGDETTGNARDPSDIAGKGRCGICCKLVPVTHGRIDAHCSHHASGYPGVCLGSYSSPT